MSDVYTQDASVRLTAETSQYEQSMTRAARATQPVLAGINAVASSYDKLVQKTQRGVTLFRQESMAQITGMVAQAAQLEARLSSLQGVAASAGRSAGYQTIERGIDQTRRSMPVDVGHVIGLAQNAQKMSVASNQVGNVTQTALKMGSATGEDPAAMMSGLLNYQRAMGQSVKSTETLADTVTALSTKLGTSAQSVLGFSEAIAPIAATLNMSTKEVLGFSAAFSKAGQDSGAAANVFTKVSQQISVAQRYGVGQRDLSDAAGMNQADFRQLSEAQQIKAVFNNLGQGGSQALNTLDRLGLDGPRSIKAIQAVSRSGALDRAFDIAGGNNAGTVEGGYEAASKGLTDSLARLRNNVSSIAEDFGSNYTGAAAKAVDATASLVDAIHKVIDPFMKLGSIVAGPLLMGLEGASKLLGAGGPLMAVAAGLGVAKGAHVVGAGLALTGGDVSKLPRFMRKNASQVMAGTVTDAGTIRAANRGARWMSHWAPEGFALPEMTAAGAEPRTRFRDRVAASRDVADARGYGRMRRAFNQVRGGAVALATYGPAAAAESARYGLASFDKRGAMPMGFVPGIAQEGLADAIAGGNTAKGGVRRAGQAVLRANFETINTAALALSGGADRNWRKNKAYDLALEGIFGQDVTKGQRRALGLPTAGKGLSKNEMKDLVGNLTLLKKAAQDAATEAQKLAKAAKQAEKELAEVRVAKGYGKASQADVNQAELKVAKAQRAAAHVGEAADGLAREVALPGRGAVAASNASSAAGMLGKAGSGLLGLAGGLPGIAMMAGSAAVGFGIKKWDEAKENKQDRIRTAEMVRSGDLDNPLADYGVALTKAGNLAYSFADRLQQAYDKLPTPTSVSDAIKITDESWALATMPGAKASNEGFAPAENNKMTASAAEQHLATLVRAGAGVETLEAARQDLSIYAAKDGVSRSDLEKRFERVANGQARDNVWLGVAEQKDKGAAIEQALGLAQSRLGSAGSQQQYVADAAKMLNQISIGGSADAWMDRDELAKARSGLAATLGVDYDELEKYESIQKTLATGLGSDSYRHGLQKWTNNFETEHNLVGMGKAYQNVDGDGTVSARTIDKSAQSYLLTTEAGRIAYQHTDKDGIAQDKFGVRGTAATQDMRDAAGRAVNLAVQSGGENADANAEAARKWVAALNAATGSADKSRTSLVELANGANGADAAMRSVAASALAAEAKWQKQSEARSGESQRGGYEVNVAGRDLHDAIVAYGVNPTGQGVRENLETTHDQLMDSANAGADKLRGMVLQERRRVQSEAWSKEDYDRSNANTKRDYDLSRERGLFDFNLQRERSEYEYDLQRARAQEDYDLQVARSVEDFNLQRSRGQEDFDQQRSRALDDYSRQQAYQLADFDKQQRRQDEDFNRQKLRNAENTAKQMFDVQNRLQAKATWSASGMTTNLSEKVAHFRKQLEDIKRLRALGLSDDAIKQLGLTDPAMAQQVSRLVQDLERNSGQIAELNSLSTQMIQIGAEFSTHDLNDAWQDTLEQYELGRKRAEEDFAEQLRRSDEQFKISMDRQDADYAKSLDRQTADFAKSLQRQSDDFAKSMERQATDHARMVKQQDADFARSRERQAEDFRTSMSDREKEFGISLKRQRDQFNQNAEILYGDITTLHDEILNSTEGATKDYMTDLYDAVEQGYSKADTAARILETRTSTAAGTIGDNLKKLQEEIKNLFGIDLSSYNVNQEIKAWEGITGARWVPGVGSDVTRYADGGVLPGYTPGTDVHQFFSPTAGQLNLSGGEAIMRPEWVKAVGGEQAVKQMNADAKYGRFAQAFADGGIFDAGKIQKAISFAASKVGMAYQWGGSGNPSYDCSGLTQAAYAHAGLPSLPHFSASQGKMGKRVSSPVPGDLVLWDNSTRNAGADHVGIYAGGGQVLEAVRPKIRRHALWGQHWFQRIVEGGSQLGDSYTGPSGGGDPSATLMDTNPAGVKALQEKIAGLSGQMSGDSILRWISTRVGSALSDRVTDMASTPLAQGTIFKKKSYMVGEAGNEMLLPLNQRGAEFLADTMTKLSATPSLPVRGHEVVRAREVSESQVVNQTYDSSVNFSGPITVKAQDPNGMARMLEDKARMKRLTSV